MSEHWISPIAVVFLLLGASPTTSAGEHGNADTDLDRCRKALAQHLARLNAYLRKKGFEEVRLDEEGLRASHTRVRANYPGARLYPQHERTLQSGWSKKKRRGKVVASFGWWSQPVSAYVDPEDGRLLWLAVWTVDHRIYGDLAPVYIKVQEPSLSREEAIAQAAEYAAIFSAEPLSRYRLARANFHPWNGRFDRDGVTYYREGVWGVIWRRLYGNVPSYDCLLCVSFSEKFGFGSFSQAPREVLAPAPQKTLSREKAIRLARRYASKWLKKHFKSYSVSEIGSTKLMYVRPNGYGTNSYDIHGPKSAFEKPAWVVTVVARHKEDPKHEQVEEFEFWVDSGNGELLGGDRVLSGYSPNRGGSQ